MTFLELVNGVRSGVGMQGNGPASVTSATQAETDIINAVKNTYIDIQNFRTEWLWLRNSVSFSMVVGQTTYTLANVFGPTYRFRHWKKETAYALINGLWTPLVYVDYDTFIYKNRNNTTAKAPRFYTVVPWNESLMFDTPNSNYQIKIDYFKSPQVLVNNNDVPEVPAYFHLGIVYAAIVRYSTVISIREVEDSYLFEYEKMLGQLMREQLKKKVIRTRGIA